MAMARLRTTVEELGGAHAVGEVDELEKRLSRYANLPGVIKGLGKLDFSPTLCDAALQVVRALGDEDALEPQVYTALFETWTMIALAARSDITVIDEVEPKLNGDHVPKRLHEIRTTTQKARERSAQPSAAPQSAPDAPQSVGKVKAWLADHPDPDLRLLAPKPKQKAGAVAAAVRALSQIGTPSAFEVLKEYATDEPTDPLLNELKLAWKRFDRREFAATMLIPRRGHLDLGIVRDITGIDAVENLTSLRIVVDDKKADQTDLSPLTACTPLQALQIQSDGLGNPSNIEWLRSLTGLRTLDLGVQLRDTDLSPLADSGIENLTIWLDGQSGSILLDMPNLTNLTVIGASSPSSEGPQTNAHPDLTEAVFTLVGRGVPVTVYDFDRDWVGELLPRAQDAGLQLIEGHGVTMIHSGFGTGRSGDPAPIQPSA
ncbi:hypothetical protein FB566_1775 [Stackebrandtia endophytica]|uniref:Leucine rich repeat (LRR) protein n=1 Tax=Stackebrandtia endophytica TaxID=1496996 RepID=A0A543AUN4_9ACTN|nr:hypothetical protein [Stackebrandtia endophytica]TQL76251.1 hypothetical protein FB566_1775 [Stackebrandtia endophytica]